MPDMPLPRDLPEIEDSGSHPDPRASIGELIATRLGRREALFGAAAALAASALGASPLAAGPAAAAEAAHESGDRPDAGPSTLAFQDLRHRLSERDSVPPGYRIQTLLRWGDPILPDAPEFDPRRQSAASQAGQFGYNCDYVDFLPLPLGATGSEHGLLWVNHEYTNTNLMFPGLGSNAREARARVTAELAAIELAAHGGSVVEIKREAGQWQLVKGHFNRRITAETEMRIAGPAAGHPRLQTSADRTGTLVRGMINNCAGGTTPWGTILTCEENFNIVFGGDAAEAPGPQREAYRRYGLVKEPPYSWYRHFARFNLDREPNEPNRFGWVVEIDPYDPASRPVKRTALGRFKHEACTHAIAPDGRVVLYMGDDERFDHVYKFVTARPWNPTDRAANRDLLDEGTLYTAKFEADGTMRWLAMVFGEGPLTPANGFAGQGDVVIEARRAADLLGATPMDRPEDVETNPVNGRVYVLLTNNASRTAQQADAANPRPQNQHGHIIEIIPPAIATPPAPAAGTPPARSTAGTAGHGRVDHAAETARWGIFLAAGKPGQDAGAQYHRATGNDGWLSCPDNCAFDSKGRIWIATDGAPGAAGVADGLYAADTAGYGRALTKLFYQAPVGAEVCGPKLTADDRTLFLAIQHPGEEPGSSFETPATRWPDFTDGMPPRPSVIAIAKIDGGVIGS